MINSVLITAGCHGKLHLTAWRTTALPTWRCEPFMEASASLHGAPLAHRSSRLTSRLQVNKRPNRSLPFPARKRCR